MAKVKVKTYSNVEYVSFYCPGCKHTHGIEAERWNWNKSVNKPTLSPSVRHFIPAGKGRSEKTICHYFVREGRIEFCGDCDHAMNGQTVELKDVSDWPSEYSE